MSSKEDIKSQLLNYKPSAEEELVIRSAMFNFITLATIGAASLGMSARLWAKSRSNLSRPQTAIPTILGTFTGLACGGALGMDKGMHKLRESLPQNSKLLEIIHENDQLKRQMSDETLFSGPVTTSTNEDDIGVQDLLLDDDTASQQTQIELIESQLTLDDDGKQDK